MGQQSKIEWTEASWNPITGCTKISPGCKNCYAERMALRLKGAKSPNYVNGFQLTIHSHLIETPLKWIKPKIIFVNSMSDMFHKDVPLDFILKLMQTMRQASWHTFQILTKRSERLKEINSEIDWPPNVWMGVSVENENYHSRIDDLRNTSARIKFLSLEPLLGSLPDLNLKGIDWVIVGGESGSGTRAMKKEWVKEIKEQCIISKVPFFFKQWGGVNKKKNGRLLDGELWDQIPLKELELKRKIC